jgi:hypothetical protein
MKYNILYLLIVLGLFVMMPYCTYAGLEAGYALRFDGINDFAVVPNSKTLSLNVFTLEAWIKIDSLNMFRNSIISKSKIGSGGFGNYSIGVLGSETLARPGTLEYVHDISNGNYSGGAYDLVISDTWTHIAVTNSGSSISWYVNGQPQGTHYFTNGPILNTSELLLGRSSLERGYLSGELDEVRIWNSVRTPEQIMENFNLRITGIPLDLVGYWGFDEAINEQNIYDLSLYANHGVLGSTKQIGVDDPIRVVSTAPIIPEPCTVSLLALGAMLAGRKRKPN